MTGPNVTPYLRSRAPGTMAEMQIVVDRLVAELTPAAHAIARVPLERTVPDEVNGHRAVLLTLSKSTVDIFGQVTSYAVPAVVHSLVHDGMQPFTFSADAVSSQAVSRLVERARRLRVDVFISRTAEAYEAQRAAWRLT